jgi:hypothetical protein
MPGYLHIVPPGQRFAFLILGLVLVCYPPQFAALTGCRLRPSLFSLKALTRFGTLQSH